MTKCTLSRRLLCLVFLLVSAVLSPAHAQTTGPQQGTLVIVGGGDRDFLVFRHFVELSGGKDAKLVVIPTASSSSPDYDYTANRTAQFARQKLEMPNVTVVHTHDRVEADSESFVQPIQDANAVWFSGGRQWRIADAYLGTLSEQAFRSVLERDGVIGGSSAGASIQGSFLVRGDTSGSNVLIGDHQMGLSYIKNSAIDQHLIPRNRQPGLIEVLTDPSGKMDQSIERASLLGIGIDEATGIVVRQNELEVVGKEDGVVLLYDPKSWKPGGDKYQILWKGAKYDLSERMVLNHGTPPHPMTASHAEGFYKDVFMDGGVSLTSRKRLPAAESLGLSYEKYAGRNPDLQRKLFVGNNDDTNGVLLYPDGQPRFRMFYVNGGAATKHGISLNETGRKNVIDFFNHGGSYCGSCAGSFLSGHNTDAKSKARDGYLHIFPYNTLNTGIKKERVGHHLPESSPLLQYSDFGGDHYVADLYHNNGNWLAVEDLKKMDDVEILATYDTPDKKTHQGVAIWAWKQNVNSGRIVNIGSHPEAVKQGERLSLTEACFQHAMAGVGKPPVKAILKNGVVHRMGKDTNDNDPLHSKIGDRQYHHFTFDIAPESTDIELELVGEGDFDLNLYLHRGAPAFRSNSPVSSVNPGPEQRIKTSVAPGQWFASVECATTVDAELHETQSHFTYKGNTDVLNGVAYSIVIKHDQLDTAR